MNFASDNWAGAAAPVAEALIAAAREPAPAYGADRLTRDVTERFAELFEREVAVFLVPTGTAANALSVSAMARPTGLLFCHRDAHINTDEGGAAEFLAGLKLIGLDGPRGKIVPDVLQQALARFPADDVHHGRSVGVSLTQLTEYGTAYRVAELTELCATAKRAGIAVHMDGARFANAVASLGASPAELSWKAGVDVLSFGGTKGGCWMAEAIVAFHPAMAEEIARLRKRSGHLVSKHRLIAAQMLAYLTDGLWLDLARHANRMAAMLAAAIDSAGGRLAWPADGNELFAILPRPALAQAKAAGATFYEWYPHWAPAEQAPREDEALVRLVTSFATTEAEVERFGAVIAKG
jgi:threonine aldolase